MIPRIVAAIAANVTDWRIRRTRSRGERSEVLGPDFVRASCVSRASARLDPPVWGGEGSPLGNRQLLRGSFSDYYNRRGDFLAPIRTADQRPEESLPLRSRQA